MCTTGDSGEIIIISDDDEDISCTDPSVVIVEVDDAKKNDFVLPPSALDEDLVVTFSRRAEVLPHARYDCPIHPFTATDCDTSAPVASNQLICHQCFCYICDKQASACEMWICRGTCHCNSHKKSEFWNNLRNSALLGGLKIFNLTLSEVDSHLRRAEMMLQDFKQKLSARFTTFLRGMPFQQCSPNMSHTQGILFDYTPVFEFVSSFLNDADKEDGRAAAIMRLGAADDFIAHFQATGGYLLQGSTANVYVAKAALLHRVVTALQRQIVMAGFTPEFIHKLQDFYKRLLFPAELKSMKNSLSLRPWDDVLLGSVLKGQNVSGIRKDKCKKDVLSEEIYVVLLRVELLQEQHRYRELCRYLRVVQTDESKPEFQQIQDLIPFFACMAGDFSLACHSLFPSLNAPASRLTPQLFLFYLRIFETATGPKLMVFQPAQLCCSDAPWEPIKDAVRLKRVDLVRFALRAQKCCSAVFTDSQCWTRLLTLVNSPHGPHTALPKPETQFLQDAREVVSSILLRQHGSSIQIPRFFQEVYPDQALLLLVTGALCQRIVTGTLSPVLPVLSTFKKNAWALWWLWHSLSSSAEPEQLKSLLHQITQELEKMTDEGDSLPFLRSVIFTLSASAHTWDHTYCCPSASELCSSQLQLLF